MNYTIGDDVIIHGSSMVFRLLDIYSGKALVSGKDYRLIKEVEIEELSLAPLYRQTPQVLPPIHKTDAKIHKGKVLHIDGDDYYLNKAIQVYKHYGVPAIGYHVKEMNIKNVVTDLINKHNPDIVVLTGHDGIITGKENDLYDEASYRFSSCYSEAVKEIRKKRPSLDDLVVISGACQSYYELLIESGSNFASSPKREFIHLLDPVIIATIVATSSIYETLDLEETIGKTITKHLGGLDTRGKARKIYLGT